MRRARSSPNAITVPALNTVGDTGPNYLFPALDGQRGTLDCSANTKIGAMGVRALGTNAISSLPVVLLPNANSGGSSVLPQFDVGDSFVSDFYAVNSGSQPADFSVAFHGDNGAAVSPPFSGLGTISVLTGSVPAGGANFYEAGTPQGTSLTGSAVIVSGQAIAIQALFRRRGSDGSYYEAAVPASHRKQ